MLHLGILRRSFLPLIYLVFMGIFAAGQNCNYELIGLIEDDGGDALPGATVILEDLKSGTATNPDGTFRIGDLCPGQYTVRIQFVGYEDELITIRIPASRRLVVQLKTSVKVLHEMVVEGNHAQTHGVSQALNILTEEQLFRNRGKSIGETLSQIPGITNIMTGPAVFKPVINGLHSQRILILNNGLRQEGQQWGIEHAPEIDPFIATEIEVVKGAESVRYGTDAMGGVIIVNAPPLHYTPGTGGEINTAFASNNRMGVLSAMVEGGTRKPVGIGWRIQGTAKKGGDYHAPDYNLSNTGTDEVNFTATIGIKQEKSESELYFSTFNTNIGILRSAHSGNLTDLQNSIVSKRPWYIREFTYHIDNPRQHIGHHMVRLRSARTLQGIGRLNVLYGFQYNQRKEYDVRRDKRDVPALDLQLYTHSLDVVLDRAGRDLTGSLGVNLVIKQNNNLTGLGLLPDFNQYTVGAFLFEKYRKGKWLLEGGSRFDLQQVNPQMYYNGEVLSPRFNFPLFSGSLGTAYYFNEHARLSGNLGITSRAPHVNEMYSQGLHHGTASIEEGLMMGDDGINTTFSDIRKERSFKWINSFQYQRKNFSAELTAYVNYLSNYIYLTPEETRLTIRGYFPVFQYRQTDALLAGSDLSAEVDLSKRVRAEGKFSAIVARDRRSGNRLPFIPPVEGHGTVYYSHPVAGRWKNVNISLGADVFLRQIRAPRVIYPADVPDEPLNETFDFMPAPPAFVLVRIDIGTNIPIGNKDVKILVSAENLLNSDYRNYMDRLRYFSDGPGRNVMLKLNYKFHSHD